MSAQAKKPSKKNKESPNGDQLLMDKFLQPQRAKSSRTIKPARNLLSQDGKENQDGSPVFDKENIPYIDKQIFMDFSLNTKIKVPEAPSAAQDTQESTESTNEDQNKIVEEVKKSFDPIAALAGKFLPSKYLFREKETKDILNFIARCAKEKSYNTLLVYGPPGTGKTTVLSHILKNLEASGLESIKQNELMDDEAEPFDYSREVNVISVNGNECESLSNVLLDVVKAVNQKIPLSVGEYMTNSKVLIDKVKQILLSKKSEKLTAVLIDDVDAFLGKSNIAKEIVELLRTPRYPTSNLIFIIASNIPDLCTKFSDQSKTKIEFDQIDFEPYNRSEASSILKNQLEELDTLINESQGNQLFGDLDIEACLNKMPALKDTDIRHVLRILQKCIKPNVPAQNNAETQPATEEEAKVELKPATNEDVLKVYEDSYNNKTSSVIATLSQKHIMCLAAIVALLAKKGGDLFVKKDLYNMYNNICGKLFLAKIDLIGLTELLGAFEAHNFIELKIKEVADKEAVKKSPPSKTPLKNVNDEYQLLINLDDIKTALKQDSYFIRFVDL